MAESGRREVVGDQLAFNARETVPDRSLPLSGIRGNNSTNNALFQEERATINAMTGLRGAIGKAVVQRQEEALVNGKTQFMSGVTEAEMRKNGDYHERLGYESLNAVNKANSWYLNEQTALDGASADMSPEDYNKYLQEKNKELFSSLPDDPAVRKIYLAAYEDVAPKLAAQQTKAYSDRNYEKKLGAFDTMLQTGTETDDTAPRRSGPSNLAISNTVIGKPYAGSGDDRDVAIKTMLGEAGGESDVGIAAVAHVLLNRSRDSRWGGSIKDVALAPKQFSTWNRGAGGNNPGRYKPGTPAYERAGRIYDAVMAGKTEDPTGGATHYYSPAGMKKLVADGDQGNLTPRWLKGEAAKSGGTLRIGNHIFVGKSSGSAGKRTQGPSLDDVPNDSGIDESGLPAKADADAQMAERKAMEAAAPMHKVGEVAPVDQVGVEQRVADAPNTQVAAAEAGVVTRDTAPAASSVTKAQIREMVAGLKPGDGAKRVAKNIAYQLSTGKTDLYDAIGGVAGIQELGGTVEDMKSITDAYDRFEKKQDTEFDAASIAAQDAVIRAVDSGETDLPTALDGIQQLVDAKIINSATAKSLGNTAAEKIRSTEGTIVPVDAQAELMGNISLLKQSITPDMTPEEVTAMTTEFAERAAEIGQRHGLKPSEVESFTKTVFSTATSEADSLRAKAETAAAKKAENDQAIADITTRVSQKRSTEGLTKRVKIGDREYSPEEAYVKLVEQDAIAAVKSTVPPDTDPKDAGAMADQIKFATLIKAGVPDKELAADMRSGVTGTLVDGKGEVAQQALQSFDLYMRVSRMPDGDKYLAGMLDQNTLSFMAMAEDSYSGNDDIAAALRTAYEEKTKVEANPAYAQQKNADFAAAIPIAVTEATKQVLATDTWIDKFFDTNAFNAEAVRNDIQAPVQTWLTRRANQLQLNQQYLNPKAATEAATKQMQEYSTIVGNSVHIAARPEDRLDRVMGIETLGRAAPQRAIKDLIEQEGPKHWGKEWEDRSYDAALPRAINPFASMATKVPKYDVSIVPQGNGKFSAVIQLWKTDKREDGYIADGNKPYTINNVKDVGDWYIKKQNERGTGASMVDSVREFLGRGAGGKFLFERQTPTGKEVIDYFRN